MVVVVAGEGVRDTVGGPRVGELVEHAIAAGDRRQRREQGIDGLRGADHAESPDGGGRRAGIVETGGDARHRVLGGQSPEDERGARADHRATIALDARQRVGHRGAAGQAGEPRGPDRVDVGPAERQQDVVDLLGAAAEGGDQSAFDAALATVLERGPKIVTTTPDARLAGVAEGLDDRDDDGEAHAERDGDDRQIGEGLRHQRGDRGRRSRQNGGPWLTIRLPAGDKKGSDVLRAHPRPRHPPGPT